MATWVIIGASRGIGYEFLRQLSADSSNTVIGTARTPEKVEQQLSTDGISNVHILAADLDKYQSLNAAAKEIETAHKSADYLVINGAFVSEETATINPSQYAGQEDLLERVTNQSILTNAIGPLHAINAFLPLIRTGKAKKIIVISSGIADPEFTDIANVASALPYSVSKAAVNIIVAKFAAELKPEGISVIAMSPGFVNTDKDSGAIDALTQAFRAYEPKLRGAITPEQSVRAMRKVFASDAVEKNNGAMISHLGNKRWLSADGVGDEVEA